MAKWKDVEKQLGEFPVQSVIGDEEIYKSIKNKINPITMFTLKLWFSVIKKHKIQKDISILKWIAYDSKFKPAKYDTGFKQWTNRGITAWCVLMKKRQLESFQNIKEKYDLNKHDFYKYLQLRNYFLKEIKMDPSGEMNGVIQTIINAYKETKVRIISRLYKKLIINKHSTEYI